MDETELPEVDENGQGYYSLRKEGDGKTAVTQGNGQSILAETLLPAPSSMVPSEVLPITYPGFDTEVPTLCGMKSASDLGDEDLVGDKAWFGCVFVLQEVNG